MLQTTDHQDTLLCPSISGRAHELSAQQHRPQQQHRQHRAVWPPMAPPGFPTRGQASPLCNSTPSSRAPSLPHTPKSYRNPCSVPDCSRNPPVWPRSRRRPGGPADWGSPVPPSCSVWGTSWGAALSRWSPLPGWKSGWVPLWHTKHSQPSDGLVKWNAVKSRVEKSWSNLVNLKIKTETRET